jgi:hypothetical protein
VKTNEQVLINLNQAQANLLLRALESLESEEKYSNVKESCHELWNQIFDAGIGAGFGAKEAGLTPAQAFDLWNIPQQK